MDLTVVLLSVPASVERSFPDALFRLVLERPYFFSVRHKQLKPMNDFSVQAIFNAQGRPWLKILNSSSTMFRMNS